MQAVQPMDLTAELAEVLRWREMEWNCIPPLSRKLVMPYLGAGDTINLDTAVTNKEDRKHLVKAYVGLRSAGLDGYAHYRADDNGVCLGVKWAQKRSIDLRNFRLEYQYVKKNQNLVLALLVRDKRKELATYFTMRCDVRDVVFGTSTSKSPLGAKYTSTLIRASEHGYLEIVQTLLGRGADVNQSDGDGNTALHNASKVEIVRALLEAGAGADVHRANIHGETPISFACMARHIEVLRALVEAGGDVDTPDSDGCTALHYASYYGFTEGVRYLVERGADVNKSSTNEGYIYTPLIILASQSGKVEVVRALLEAGADVNKRDQYSGDTALHVASENGDIEMARALLEAGAGADVRRANVRGLTPIFLACNGKHIEVLRALVEAGEDVDTPDSRGYTALHGTSERGFTEGVRYLVERGADVNKSTGGQGYTPLILARKVKVVRALLEAGADVHKRDSRGDTALQMASLIGNTEIVRALLEAGAGADVRRANEDGCTPISHACHSLDVETFCALMEAGGDVDTPDSNGRTALHDASWYGLTEGVRYLVERGADVNKSSTNEFGETPLTLASRLDEVEVEVVRALLEAGADANKRDGYGRSPLYYALKEDSWHTEQERQGKAQIAALLREAGAQEQ